MKLLILKNLTTHRERNQLTAIIQSLTLGCIIFLITMLNLQVKAISSYSDYASTDLYAVYSEFSPSAVTSVLQEFEYGLSEVGFSTVD